MRRSTLLQQSLRRTFRQAIPALFVIVTLGYVLLWFAPGDAATAIAAESGSATEETMARLRESLNLNQSFFGGLLSYYSSLAHGSLGNSVRYGMPVTDLILSRLPGSLLLMGLAILLAFTIGVTFGTVMAIAQNRWPDRLLSVLSLLCYSLPSFWIGLMLIVLFSVKLRWLPSSGGQSFAAPTQGIGWMLDRLRHLVLPTAALALYYLAVYARLTRAAVLEAKGLDHVRTAVAKGITRGQVVRRHILRNALSPVVTMAGMHVAGILGGAVVIETVFAWPGMGRLAYEAILAREYVVLLGIFLVSAILVMVVNAAVDLAQSALEPRVGSKP